MPTISVIVPVYKVEAYLHRCVDSILAQSLPDFELILVDDGSPDRCGEICEEYAAQDGRIHVIHQENGGLSAARNTGIDWVLENSGSQWLAFVDSDDWVSPDYLRQLYRAAAETECRLSVCGFFRTGGEEIPPQAQFTVEAMSAEDYYCGGNVHDGVTMVAWNKLYHRSLFETLRYPVGKLHEDEFTSYLAVYAAGTVGVIAQPLYAYYQNPAGIMRSKWDPRRMHSLEAVEQQIAFARSGGHPQLLKKAAKQYIYSAYAQLEQAQKSAEYRSYCGLLRKKLRWGLKQGRSCGVFAFTPYVQWAYETAYPIKPLWWLYNAAHSGPKKARKP